MIKDKSYSNLQAQNALGLLKPAIKTGRLTPLDDGRFHVDLNMAWFLPWAFIKHRPDFHCYIWHFIYWSYCNFIPAECHNCWKIVVRPRNLKAAFDLYDVMCELDYPSKVGWEDRKTVFGNFGAYFYNASLEEAKTKFAVITEAIRDIPLLQDPYTGKDIQPLIKRGCTEYEMKHGPSNEWEMTEEAKQKQRLLDSVVNKDLKLHVQHDWYMSDTMLLWIHNAYSTGDLSVPEFTNGKKLFPPYVTYNQEKDNG